MVRSILVKLGMLTVTLAMIAWIGWTAPADRSDGRGLPDHVDVPSNQTHLPTSHLGAPPSQDMATQGPPASPIAPPGINPPPAPTGGDALSGVESSPTQPAHVTSKSPRSTPSQKSAAFAGSLDLNRATIEDLDRLPGFGPTLARRVVDYRRANGPFSSIEDLLRVRGVGPKKLDRIRDHVTVVTVNAGMGRKGRL